MTSTELGYLSGVTSNIQDQLNGKVKFDSGTNNVSIPGILHVSYVNNAVIHRLYFGSNTTQDIYLGGRGYALIGITENGIGGGLWALSFENASGISSITSISKHGTAEIGAYVNEDYRLTITAPQWSYGFIIMGGVY